MRQVRHYATPAVERRKRRVRDTLNGTAKRPRISVHRTNRFISVQAIDDAGQKTLAVVSDRPTKSTKKPMAGTKIERATAVGTTLAQVLQQQKITTALFDRGEYRYHGRVKAVAESLRAGGIQV